MSAPAKSTGGGGITWAGAAVLALFLFLAAGRHDAERTEPPDVCPAVVTNAGT